MAMWERAFDYQWGIQENYENLLRNTAEKSLLVTLALRKEMMILVLGGDKER